MVANKVWESAESGSRRRYDSQTHGRADSQTFLTHLIVTVTGALGMPLRENTIVRVPEARPAGNCTLN
jgi:hypothetical protein